MLRTQLAHARRRARLRYEWTRLRRAVLGFAPAVLLVGAGASLNPRPAAAGVFGLTVSALGIGLLWYGQNLQRALLPGLAAGALPLAVALGANRLHACGGGACLTWCLPACALGGLGAGLAIAAVGHRGRRGSPFWITASCVAVLTGAIGCACIGLTGLLGLTAGFGVGLLLGESRSASA